MPCNNCDDCIVLVEHDGTRILKRELLFANDSALVAHSAEEMHNIVEAFSNASKKFGLKIDIKKTEMLYQPNSTRN